MDDDIPMSRTYVHTRCGTATEVTDSMLLVMSDPFSACVGTFCAGCDKHFPLKQFTWEDTGERVSDARARLAELAPGWVQALLRPAGCWAMVAAGLLVGAGLGFGISRIGKINHWPGAVLGGLGGVIAALAVLAGWVSPRWYGVITT